MKKILSLLLSVALVLGMCPTVAWAAVDKDPTVDFSETPYLYLYERDNKNYYYVSNKKYSGPPSKPIDAEKEYSGQISLTGTSPDDYSVRFVQIFSGTHHVVLDNLTLNAGDPTQNLNAMLIGHLASSPPEVTLTLKGTSTLKGSGIETNSEAATDGLKIIIGSKVTITGGGTLNAVGGSPKSTKNGVGGYGISLLQDASLNITGGATVNAIAGKMGNTQNGTALGCDSSSTATVNNASLMLQGLHFYSGTNSLIVKGSDSRLVLDTPWAEDSETKVNVQADKGCYAAYRNSKGDAPRTFYENGQQTLKVNKKDKYGELVISNKTYSLQVDGGSGSGSYRPQAEVSISAQTPSGHGFKQWKTVSGGGSFKDPAQPKTAFTMPWKDARVEAEFLPLRALTVAGGTADPSQGIEGASTVLTLDESKIPSGQVFSHWVLKSGPGTLSDPYDPAARFTFGGGDATVEAVYVEGARAGDFLVSPAQGFAYSDGVLTFSQPDSYTVRMGPGVSQTKHRIRVEANEVELLLSGVDIHADTGDAIWINGSTTLKLSGKNSAVSEAGQGVALGSTSLVITSAAGDNELDGSLTAKGQIGIYQPSDENNPPSITINGGTINATGGYGKIATKYGVGIGWIHEGRAITINGGHVTATGGGNGGVKRCFGAGLTVNGNPSITQNGGYRQDVDPNGIQAEIHYDGVGSRVESLAVSPGASEVPRGQRQQFTAELKAGGHAGKGVEWSVSGGSAGTSIDKNGWLTVAPDESARTLTVTATNPYSGKSATASVTVRRYELKVDWPSGLACTYGQMLGSVALKGSAQIVEDGQKVADIQGAFTWKEPGKVLNAGSHSCPAVFTPEELFQPVERDLPVTVAPATPGITWTNASASLPYGFTESQLRELAAVNSVNNEIEKTALAFCHAGKYNLEFIPGLPVNVGEYQVKARLAASANYTEAESPVLTLNIVKADQPAPAAPTAEDANITENSITLTEIPGAEYNRNGGEEWQDSPVFSDLDSGMYYVFYARLKADENHNPSPKSDVGIIRTKASAENPIEVTLLQNTFTYDGEPHEPEIIVKIEGEEVSPDAYTAYYSSKINAGTGLVAVFGKGSYAETQVNVPFTILPKPLTVTGAAASGRQYDGTDRVEITGVTLDRIVQDDKGKVAVKTGGLAGTLPSPDAGAYTSVTLPAMTLTGTQSENYTLTQPGGAVSCNVAISKTGALEAKPGSLAVVNKQASSYTFDLGSLLPDAPRGMSLGSAAVTYSLGAVSLGDYYKGGAKIEGQTLTLPIEEVESDKERPVGTVTVTIHTSNFEDMTATINVSSVNKTIPTGAPTLSATAITYGQAIGTIILSGDMQDGNTPVRGTFTWSSPENRPSAQDSYSAAWVFTPDDKEKYAVVNGTSGIKVNPAPISGAVITLSETVYRFDDKPHSPSITGVKLGNTALTAEVDYTAEIQTATQAGTYTVTVTGKGNYIGTATTTFRINPVETSDEFVDNGTTMRLEVETGLSTVPTALENHENLNTPAKIETALRVAVENVMANVEDHIAVFDVTLQYKDASGNWHNVDPDKFPENGVTAILPYPDGTGATGYTFTVQHLISSGDKVGEMETLPYTPTADGLKCTFNSLSPVAIGYEKKTSSGGSSGGGWYPSISYYSVKVRQAEHGKVTADRTNIYSGGTVTLTVTPDNGYKLGSITVTDSQNKAIKVTEKNGKYTFKMPSHNVTVSAVFVPVQSETPSPSPGPQHIPIPRPLDFTQPIPSPWQNPFPDVKTGAWYWNAVEYVSTEGLMNGYKNGKFAPNDIITRGSFAQIIYNKADRPSAGSGKFTDVKSGQWYANAVNWAAEAGVVSGIGGGKYAPNDPITREQLATMLWRYAGSPTPSQNSLDFKDADKVSKYARTALCWAQEKGIMNGKGNGILDPRGTATRTETAQMLMNYLK